jgi:hypothetical protein
MHFSPPALARQCGWVDARFAVADPVPIIALVKFNGLNIRHAGVQELLPASQAVGDCGLYPIRRFDVDEFWDSLSAAYWAGGQFF